jgi:hypothetical protein
MMVGVGYFLVLASDLLREILTYLLRIFVLN